MATQASFEESRDQAERVRRAVMEMKQNLEGWEWEGIEVEEPEPVVYKLTAIHPETRRPQVVWFSWDNELQMVLASKERPTPAPPQGGPSVA